MPSAAKARRLASKKPGGRAEPAPSANAPTANAPAAAEVQVRPAAGDPAQRGGPPPSTHTASPALTRRPPAARCAAQVVFPPSLTPRQRAAVHAVGEAHGLPHASAGDGDQRQVSLGPAGAPTLQLAGPAPGLSELPDAELVQLIMEHLRVDAAAAFAERPARPAVAAAAAKQKPGPGGANGSGGGGAPIGEGLSSGGRVDVDQFVSLMAELLQIECAAEVAASRDALSASSPEAAQARGRALLNLRLSEAEGGLLGRTLLTLVSNRGAGAGADPLPPHKFSPHDIVRLRPSRGDAGGGGAALAEGVVYRVREGSITVAVDEAPGEGLGVPLRLEKLANEVTYHRLQAAVRALGGATGGGGPAATLVDVLFGRAAPRFAPAPPAWAPVNAALDASQRRAVSRALAAADLALIHGPPGTGKTTAVVELILQEAARGGRVLACAASNVAVDNLVERLVAARLPGGRRVDVVRVGHPARLLPAVLEASLEARVLRSDGSALARDCRAEIKAATARLLKLDGARGGAAAREERRALRADLRRLAKEERQRQQRAVDEVLSRAQVVCATLTGVGGRQLSSLPAFDLVVVDEAAQALEAACWAALLRGRRAVLAGDHLQLPPTVTSQAAAARGLLVTLFERAHALWGAAAAEMLTVQYRMNAAIMEWASREMYGGRLTAAAAVAGHTLAGSLDGGGGGGGGEGGAGTLPVLLLIDSAGCDMEESREADGESTCNAGEAAAAMAHVARLLRAGVAARDIGVITPYSAQVGLLRELRAGMAAGAAEVEIATVDGFQGREKEAVVISAVRSNARGEVGFLSDARRMNVAVTRARRHCALVCNAETLGGDPFLGRLVKYFEDHGEYASAQEYADEL